MILTEELTIKKHYDVIVAGGGVAGIAAAVQAAREGKNTLLVKKSQKLGGLATLGLINLFVPTCNGRGKPIIKGISQFRGTRRINGEYILRENDSHRHFMR